MVVGLTDEVGLFTDLWVGCFIWLCGVHLCLCVCVLILIVGFCCYGFVGCWFVTLVFDLGCLLFAVCLSVV